MEKNLIKQWSLKERYLLLIFGIILTVLSGFRWGVELLAWINWIPFLMFSMGTKGWKNSLLLLAALLIGVNGMTAKIITEPVPFVFTFIFGVPTGFSAWIMLLIWEKTRQNISYHLWIPSFVSLVVFSEWTTFRYSDFGMWGTMASTQVNNLELLQIASITGISGIAAIMAMVSIWGAIFLSSNSKKKWYRAGVLIGILLFATISYGSFRIYKDQKGKTVKTAAIVTDLHISPNAFPTENEISDGTNELFIRSHQACKSGAKIIVWNEGATMVNSSDESDLIERGAQFSIENSVDLIMAYIVPISHKPLKFDNKYVWFNSNGEILETYRKHHPVPGEGAIRGTEELMVHKQKYGFAAGALCYDYDFPEMAIEHGKKGAGIVVVPSSDWRGIDPYHSKMTRIRAIEGGFSVLRPVRWATSMAFDAYGRIRAAMPYNEGNRIMIVDLPSENIKTLYTRLGDWLVIPSVFLWLYLISTIIRKWEQKRKA